MANAGQAVFDVAERDEDPLPITSDRFLECCFRVLVVRAISATGKDRQRHTRPDRPDPAVPLEQRIDLAAQIATRAGQSYDGEECGFGYADLGVGRSQLPLSLRDIGPAFQQLPRQTCRNLGRAWVPFRVESCKSG